MAARAQSTVLLPGQWMCARHPGGSEVLSVTVTLHSALSIGQNSPLPLVMLPRFSLRVNGTEAEGQKGERAGGMHQGTSLWWQTVLVLEHIRSH